jgi:hypothetical protein
MPKDVADDRELGIHFSKCCSTTTLTWICLGASPISLLRDSGARSDFRRSRSCRFGVPTWDCHRLPQEIATRPDADKVFDVLNGIWGSRLAKTDVVGTHRTLFYGLRHKRQYYPTLRDEAINPHGTRLR